MALITRAFIRFSIRLIYIIISSSAFIVFVYMRLLYRFTPLTLAEHLVLQERPKLVSILLFVLLGGGLVFIYMCGCYISKFEFEDNN